MNVEEAAQEFVDVHKDNNINVDYIVSVYGSVEEYLRDASLTGDDGDQYVEVSRYDTTSGNAEIITWTTKAINEIVA